MADAQRVLDTMADTMGETYKALVKENALLHTLLAEAREEIQRLNVTLEERGAAKGEAPEGGDAS